MTLQSLIKTLIILNHKIESKLYTNEEDKKFFPNRVIALILIAAIAFLMYTYNLMIPGIFNRNFDAPLKSNISFVMLLGVLSLFMIAAGLLQKPELAKIALPGIAIFLSIFFMPNYIVWLSLFFMIGMLYLYFNKGYRPNLWIYFTIFMMLLLFFGGIYLIDAVYGYDNLKFKFPTMQFVDGGGINYANLTCSPLIGTKIIASESTNCTISPPVSGIYQLEGNATIVTISGDEKTLKMYLPVDSSNTLYFIPPSDVAFLGFSISYKDANGRSVSSLINRYLYKFYTKEDEQNFMTSSIVLLGVILFSVPSMMVSFRKLSNPSDEKENKQTTWDNTEYN